MPIGGGAGEHQQAVRNRRRRRRSAPSVRPQTKTPVRGGGAPEPYSPPTPEKFVAPKRSKSTRGARRSGTTPAAPGRAPQKRVGGPKKLRRQERNAAKFRRRVTRANRRIASEAAAVRERNARRVLYRFRGAAGANAITDDEYRELEAYKKTPRYERGRNIARAESGLRKLEDPREREARVYRAEAKLAKPGVLQKKVLRPAGQVLNETTRVSDFLAGFEKKIIKNVKEGNVPGPEDIFGAAKAGWESGGSRSKVVKGEDVLAEAGVPKGKVRKIAGTGLDIAQDPLTWIPVGKGAKALTAPARATRAGRRAAAKAGPKRPALRTPAERRAAARTRSRAARKAHAASTKRSRRVGLGGDPHRPVRDTASKFFPVRPNELTPAEQTALITADRRRRGLELTENKRTARIARGARRVARGQRTRLRRKPMSDAQNARIRDAIERQDLTRLSPREKRAAEILQRESERQLSAKRAASIQARESKPARYEPRTAEEPPGYAPRVPLSELSDEAVESLRRPLKRRVKKTERAAGRKRTGKGLGSIRTRTVTHPQRTNREFASELRDKDPAALLEDLETTLTIKGQKAWREVAHTEFRTAVRRMGRPATLGARTAPDEAVFITKETPAGKRLVQADMTQAADRGLVQQGQGVVLRKAVADHANKSLDRTGYIPFVDPLTNKIKWALTIPNPQYWLRNAYGGLYNAWAAGMPAHAVARNLPRAVLMNRRIASMARREELGKPALKPRKHRGTRVVGGYERQAPGAVRVRGADVEDIREKLASGYRQEGQHLVRDVPRFGAEREMPRELRLLEAKTVNVGKAGKMKVRDLVREMEHANVSGGGQTQELLGAVTAPRHVAQSMEDLPRLTAYFHFRRKGLSPDAASAKVQGSQFDYGQLTGFERATMRRIFPFYTWRSRNIALQARTLVERPGKLATVEKLRDLAADLSGKGEFWEEKLSRGEALQLPIPVGDQLAFPALPVTDLNMLPAGSPEDSIKMWAEQGMQMLNPIFKNPVEFFANYSFYFREQLESDYNRWTPAPAMPAPLRDVLVGRGWMKKNAEGTWEWRNKAKYLVSMLPASSLAAAGATGGTEEQKETFKGRAIGWLSGVRFKKFAPLLNDYTKLWDEYEKIEAKLADLSELEIDKNKKGQYTGETAKLKNQANAIRWRINDLAKRLDKDISEPQTKRTKVYKKGYDPETGENLGGESSDTAPPWATPTETSGQKKARRKQEKAPWE